MKKKLIVMKLLLIVSTGIVLAQLDNVNKHSLFLELGGTAGHFSLNYERTIPTRENKGLELGIGFSPGLLDNSGFSPRISIQAKFNFILERHSINVGTAFTPYIYSSNDGKLSKAQLAIFAQIGYKYQIKNSHLYLGLAFTPIIWDTGIFDFTPWGAVRIGYNFKRN